MKDYGLIFEACTSELLCEEVLKDFWGGEAFEPGGCVAVTESLYAAVESASSGAEGEWEMVSIDDSNGEVPYLECDGID